MRAATRRPRPMMVKLHRLIVACGIAAPAAVLFGVAAVLAAGTNAGAALIQDGGGNNINSGGSQTVWTIILPPGAKCTQDSSTGNFTVDSYLVDTANNPDPSALTFATTGVPNSAPGGIAFNLVDASGAAWNQKATAPITAQVPTTGNLNFAKFSFSSPPRGNKLLPAGNYHIGIACVKPDNTVDNFWDAQITFKADGADPNGETWTVGSSSPPPTTTTTSNGTTTTTSNATTTTTSNGTTTTTTDNGTTTTTQQTTTTDAAVASQTASSDPASGSAALATTGGSPWPMVLVAAGLAYVGYVLVLLSRRRRLRSLAAMTSDNPPPSRS